MPRARIVGKTTDSKNMVKITMASPASYCDVVEMDTNTTTADVKKSSTIRGLTQFIMIDPRNLPIAKPPCDTARNFAARALLVFGRTSTT
jgi:hypothetical protein